MGRVFFFGLLGAAPSLFGIARVKVCAIAKTGNKGNRKHKNRAESFD